MGDDHTPSAFDQPLQDALDLFSSLQLPYALIGGLAAMFYGRSRFTEDIDFVLPSHHQAVFKAHPDAMRAYRFDPSCTYKLYHDSGMEIDIWKDEFSDAIVDRALDQTLGRWTVRIAEPHDLVAMKLRARRLQDDYDISEIIKSTPLNHTTLASRVTPDEFAHFLAILARTR
jgi:hypothetical protein